MLCVYVCIVCFWYIKQNTYTYIYYVALHFIISYKVLIMILAAVEKFNACCCIAEITGRDITQVCFDIISDSWLCIGSEGAQANIDMDMV